MRWDIINHLINKNNYKNYLEIGYYKGWSFDRVECEQKTAVDPHPCKEPWMESVERGTLIELNNDLLYKLPSDDFFSLPAIQNQLWDIIFIDGLHEAKQVSNDIYNSLHHLAPNGTVVLHDCNPPKYEHTTTGIDGCWTGDTYKAFLDFRFSLTPWHQFDAYCIDTDWGVGIIAPRTSQNCDYFSVRQTNWQYFDQQRKALLNLISVEEFLQK